MTPIRSIIQPRRALVASSSFQIELGVNPISHLDVTYFGIMNGNQQGTMLGPQLGFLGPLRVTRAGVSMFDLTGADAAAAGYFMQGFQLENIGSSASASARFAMTLRIPFGRRPYDPTECFPETKRGELLLEINTNALPGSMASGEIQVVQHEMPGAAPVSFLRSTTLQRTPTATGNLDIDLPLGNTMVGMTMFGTTVPTAAVNTATIAQARLLVENKETWYASSSWYDLKGSGSQYFGGIIGPGDHIHVENTAAAYAQFALSGLPQTSSSFLSNYAYMDLDPDKLGTFALDLSIPSQAVCRIDAGDTNLLRLIPHNLISVK